MKVDDFTTDPSLAFLGLLKDAGALPDYVKEVPEAADVTGLMDIAFADTSSRAFPLNSKSSAFLSAVSAFVYGHAATEPWMPRLKSACHAYGIDEDVKRAHELLARKDEEAPEKKASETRQTKYAMVLGTVPDQPTHQYYPISSADQVEDSALKLARDIADDKLPTSWFAEACENLMKAAAELEVPDKYIPATVRRLGTPLLPDPHIVAAALAKRAAAGVPEAGMDFYRESAEEVLNGSATPMEGAHVWEMADRKFKLAGFTGGNSPVFVFKSGHSAEHVEQLKKATTLVADVLLPHAAFLQLPDRFLAGCFSESDAVLALKAKKASDGRLATGLVSEMTEAGQLHLLKLLADAA